MTPPAAPADADMLLANWRILVSILSIIAFGLSVGIFFLARTIKKNMPVLKQFQTMVEDWTGEPAVEEDGPNGKITTKKARFGMMARMQLVEDAQIAQVESMRTQNESLARLEDVQHEHGEQIKVVHKELNTNHGSSVKDALKRTESDVKSMKGVVHDLNSKFENLTDVIGSKVKPMLSLEATINHNTTTTTQDHAILEEG